MSGTASFPGWYVEFQANVLRQLPRPGELEQVTAEGWNTNQQALKKSLAEVLIPDAIVKQLHGDDRFFLLDTFKFTVSKNYDHATQLAKFAKENRKKFYHYNDAITDANYAKATNRLVSGKIYEAKVFGIKSGKVVSSPDCLAFLKTQGALLVGAQGISVAWQEAKEKFPKGKWLASFDEKDLLWQDSGGYRGVPNVDRNLGSGWTFCLGYFEDDWYDDYCLLCLRDVSA